MSQELKGSLNNALNLNGYMQSSGNLRGQFQLGGGGGGTTDYDDLSNKPSINGHTLEGDSSTADLQLDYDDLLNKPVIPDMSGYYDKDETDALLADKFDKDNVTYATYENKIDVAIVERAVDAHGNYYTTITNQGIGPFYTETETDNFLSAKADTADLATVATTGDYDDLLNKPVIPSGAVTDISSEFTITKTSGNWSVDSISAYRTGNVVQILITITGNGSSVSAGSNGFVGKITAGPLPPVIVRLVGYYNNCPVMMQIEPDGSVTGRVLAVNVTITSTGKLPLSATYITDD